MTNTAALPVMHVVITVLEIYGSCAKIPLNFPK